MSDYTVTYDGAGLDADGNAIVRASDWDAQLDAIAIAIATKTDLASSPTTGNILEMDANGQIVDSGIASANLDGLTGVVQTVIGNKVDRQDETDKRARAGQVQILDESFTSEAWAGSGSAYSSGFTTVTTSKTSFPDVTPGRNMSLCHYTAFIQPFSSAEASLEVHISSADQPAPSVNDGNLVSIFSVPSNVPDSCRYQGHILIPINEAGEFRVHMIETNCNASSFTIYSIVDFHD